jgi:predicted extracellular nuclease
MNRFLLSAFVLMTIASLECCKEKKELSIVAEDDSILVAFYNVENLFDTADDPAIKDEEFTPTGRKAWTEERLQDKVEKLAKVLSSLSEQLPDVVGLCEVENRDVVQMLRDADALAAKDYQIVHKDSPDGRGIDVALIYDANKITVDHQSYIQSKLPIGDRPNTRLVLYARGVKNNDTLHFFVNHWPSRYGGQEKSEPNRLTVAYNVKNTLDSIRKASPDARIVLMGDFNDYPNNKSINEIIGAGIKSEMPFYNMMWETHKAGKGSYNYKGEWGCLDQFIVSQGTVNASSGFSVKPDAGQIIKHDWMMYVNKEGVAYPNRTYGGPQYYGGYSDHLPILMKMDYSD